MSPTNSTKGSRFTMKPDRNRETRSIGPGAFVCICVSVRCVCFSLGSFLFLLLYFGGGGGGSLGNAGG